jgi:hypothetical protein
MITPFPNTQHLEVVITGLFGNELRNGGTICLPGVDMIEKYSYGRYSAKHGSNFVALHQQLLISHCE